MKQREVTVLPYDAETAISALAEAMNACTSAAEIRAFLVDLCTPAELEAMADRWRVVPHLLLGEPYREVHERTAVSVTTIGRVARTLERGAGGYANAASRLRLPASTEGKS
ncbi:YerC/YecD family TrpR-related protein [Solilutibacter silvestris]|uniref:TrpR-like protein YerC/YecD n=1 Tax=Solilutibacter silvestris TaxID=1645665 RepID=A0A2K1PZZ2_9GAMM|nr:YerC/YecD family TrpR-related protein [Lysobacter silvestris]PNS08361.1 TrpR-like protein YerC/YecD [Lysobacter silvestris]